MNYYVIPDIHGMNTLLQLALDEIYDREPDGCKIIFLGDYIDRGPYNVDVIKTIMSPPEKYEFVLLKGNHEDMFIEAYRENQEYYDANLTVEITDSDLSFEEIADFFSTLKHYHFEDDNIFAHAWYELNATFQIPHINMWERVPDLYPFGPSKYLTHGHTPRRNGPTLAPNRCNLDCGAVFTGRLVFARFEQGKMGPQEFIEKEL